LKRIPTLDALRGIAILLVLALHLRVPYISVTYQLGVDLFFVLSGFLISGQLFKEYREHGTIRLGRFWIRRSFKILPPLYTFLLVMILLVRNHETVNGALHAGLFYMNFSPVQGHFLHTWSLAVEEQFYLLLPLLLLTLIRFSPNRIGAFPVVFVLIVVAVTSFRIFMPDPELRGFHYGFFYLRCDALFSGVMVRYLHDFRPSWFQKLARYGLIPGLFFWLPAVFMAYSPANLPHSLLYSGVVFGCSCLLAWCFAHSQNRFWNWPPFRALAFVGAYSYSIYLWSFPITDVLRTHDPSVSIFVLGFVASIGMGVIAGKLIELPSVRFRDRLMSKLPYAERPSGIEAVDASGLQYGLETKNY
jgi:peptidoglycan/LPS O-acetylase OafA/YrhL